MPHPPLDFACDECNDCCGQTILPSTHDQFFNPISKSPTEGIDFTSDDYTANQLSDAFTHLIPGHMDWPIKKIALETWDELISNLRAKKPLHTKDIDLEAIFKALDDILFLRALQESCRVS